MCELFCSEGKKQHQSALVASCCNPNKKMWLTKKSLAIGRMVGEQNESEICFKSEKVSVFKCISEFL